MCGLVLVRDCQHGGELVAKPASANDIIEVREGISLLHSSRYYHGVEDNGIRTGGMT